MRTYYVHFLNFRNTRDGHGCMGLLHNPPGVPLGDERISTGKQPDGSGNISATSATIPNDAESTNVGTGPALVCFISGTASGPDYAYGTDAAQVTIL